ncbi:cellulose binding domain-containing protein, partial [Streptomyces microflavus]|uniref:pectate lyase family protein n=1 Tax=Streptomyces microflavus TaxID=1919 RepID=UPI003F4D5EC6
MIAATTVALLATGTLTAVAAHAAPGCAVSYTVGGQWQGGFTGNITISNLGDPLSGWSLRWSYSAGQTVSDAWNATVAQSGSTVTATNVGYNGSVPTGGSVSFGFNGTWNNSSNPVPTSFTVNGVTCTGSTAPTNAPTTPPSATPPPTTPPATTPPPSVPQTGLVGWATQNGGTTGGAGGQTVRASTGTAIHAALCNRASSSTPIVIEVQGTINHGNTTKVSGNSCNTAADKIELKEISNVTIVGVGSGAVFDQLGIHIRDSRNIIIQNVTVRNVKKSGSPISNGGDAIGMESSVRNVWVDHTTLEASGGESAGYDGLFDMKDDVQYVTLSYSILRNSGRGGLIGSSESDRGNGFVTFHHNLYQNIDSRTPLLRGGIAHIYNNSYVQLNESGINSRAGARAKVENNYFKNSRDVLGTFYTSEAGYWQASGNILDSVTWSSPGSETNPAGPGMPSNTSVSIPYSYRLDGASCVPDIVRQTAGANTGLKESNGSCSPTTPTPTTPGPTTPAPTTPGPPPPP